jgi:hypothetical protein
LIQGFSQSDQSRSVFNAYCFTALCFNLVYKSENLAIPGFAIAFDLGRFDSIEFR